MTRLTCDVSTAEVTDIPKERVLPVSLQHTAQHAAVPFAVLKIVRPGARRETVTDSTQSACTQAPLRHAVILTFYFHMRKPYDHAQTIRGWGLGPQLHRLAAVRAQLH